MRFIILSAIQFLLLSSVCAQIPAGYYDSANGLQGVALKSALHQIIDDHTSIPYSDIDQYFPQTDKKTNGKVWDMYSYSFSGTQPYEYSYGVHECDAGLQYNSEGDCFNKEHIWPQSYFNSQAVPRGDLHQVYPTDGWVNNKRSNFPFGNLTTVNWTSDNGSKVGTGATYSGYTGKMFEPLDSFKGDIARSIFYTSTRYYTEDASWDDWEMAAGADLSPDAITLLLQWHDSDPVSAKEIDRNNKIYTIQGNRNPYIDHPQLVDCVWGTNCQPLAIEEHSIEISYTVSNGILELPFQAEHISILNTIGQTVLTASNVSSISLTDLTHGIYVGRGQYDQQAFTIKFIKK